MFLELEEVDSTNEEAKRQLSKGNVEHGSIVWAKKQTLGKGRLGRRWNSSVGDLAFSMIVHPDLSRTNLPQYAPFIACVLTSVISWYFDDPNDVFYKWPNDILIRGKKVAGVLIESFDSGQQQVLIIGIGINVVSSPLQTFFPATHMQAEGVADVTDFSLMSRILSEYDVWWQFWHLKGFPLLILDLARHLYGMDKMMRIQVTPNKWVDGICRGIDKNGCLLLEDYSGKVEIYHSGDVFML